MEVIVVGCVLYVLASFGFSWFVFLLTTVAYHDVSIGLKKIMMDVLLSSLLCVSGGNHGG